MFPTIDKRETGINLRKLMDKHGLSVKDVQEYMGFSNVQGIYHWLNGRSMPTIDNLYALSRLLGVTMDEIVCGTRPAPITHIMSAPQEAQNRRVCAYYEKIQEHFAA